MLLLYFGYVGLAVYLYLLIHGSLWAYAATCLGLGAVLWLCFTAYFRNVK